MSRCVLLASLALSFFGAGLWQCKSAQPAKPSSSADSAPAIAPRSVRLPGGAQGIGFDDLSFGTRTGRVLAPAGGTGALDLVDPRTFEVTVVPGKGAVQKYGGGHDDGITSADEARGVLLAIDRTEKLLLAHIHIFTALQRAHAAPERHERIHALARIRLVSRHDRRRP